MKISCIIPAYNEEKSIANTLRVITAVPELFEIIVVNDCSKDSTRNIIETFPNVKLINNEQNMGKSKSVARGIEESTGDYLFFIDADLLGLTSETIKSLIQPIERGVADVVISYRENTPKWFIALVGVEILSGDRIFPRSLLVGHMEGFKALPSYGMEVYLNKIIIENKLRVASVLMNGVQNDFKWNKRGVLYGLKQEINMWRNGILKVVSLWGFIVQNYNMRQLLVK